ncbi:MAG: alanine--tRNA ligase [Desulfurococcales archaeon]|nr:alanine--tRNA ligase [Desulfurococcales archaeon]
MDKVDPKEYEIEFFYEMGFKRKRGTKCKEYYWTLNEELREPQDTPCVRYWFNEIPSVSPLTVTESRREFIRFFEERGHAPVKPRPVVARWRDDLYLTIASIVVFQPHVTSGLVPPPANPLVISQPSIRLEDIDNVGLTIGRHLTSFEMAAHHAFNYPDKQVYWKDETVRYAFEFFTKTLGIPGDLIVFKESWWEGGGNAGPSFEVAVGGLELATLVFMKYRVVDGGYEEIPLKIVDTGYGVERIAWFTQKTPTAFHAIYGDLLQKYRKLMDVDEAPGDVLWSAFKEAGLLDPEDEESLRQYYTRIAKATDRSVDEVRGILEREARLYSVLDHARTLALMLADGIVPSNSGEGYLARLVARRALRQMRLLGSTTSLADLVELQVEYWSHDFPQLKENRDYVLDAVSLEEEKFKDSLSKGVSLVAREVSKRGRLGLQDLVRLYESHGIPPEIVSEEARKRGVIVEVPHNFYSIIASMHKAPRELRKGGKESVPVDVASWARGKPPTRPLFHEDPYMKDFKARIVDVMDKYVVLDATAFYPTGGGQIHDTGVLVVNGVPYRVVDVVSVDDVIVHVLDRPVRAEPGEPVYGEIDWRRRYRIMRHHTATHVLISAARRVLGRHVWQAGAEKTEEKGRLDITHHRGLSKDQVKAIEDEVNRVIDERRPVYARIEAKNDAEEKYGFIIYQGGVPMKKDIRIVEVEGWDVEACYGTHVKNTGEIGSFKIINVEKIQDGVIRLEYIAGTRLSEEARILEDKLDRIAELTGASKGREIDKVKSILSQARELEGSLKKYRELWLETAYSDIEKGEIVNGLRIYVAKSPEADRRVVKDLLRKMTSRYSNLLAVMLVELKDRILVEMAAGESVPGKVDLAVIARELASSFNGKGGGKGTYASVMIESKVSLEEIKNRIMELIRKG